MGNNQNNAFVQRTKVMTKLYNSGCNTEKELLDLSIQDIVNLDGITVAEIKVITELQKAVKAHTLYSFLGGAFKNEQQGSG